MQFIAYQLYLNNAAEEKERIWLHEQQLHQIQRPKKEADLRMQGELDGLLAPRSTALHLLPFTPRSLAVRALSVLFTTQIPLVLLGTGERLSPP